MATISSELIKDLSNIRDNIALLDNEIVTLLSERMVLSKKIGIIKTSKNLPIRNYGVEAEVIARVKSNAKLNGISEDLIENVYRLIIEESVQLQQQLIQYKEKPIEQSGNDFNKPKCLIIGGLGKMGSFFSLLLTQQKYEVHIVDKRPTTKINTFMDLPNKINDYDLIVVATHLERLKNVYSSIIDAHPRGIIVDIASIKSEILDLVEHQGNNGLKITSIHPMFGPTITSLTGRNIIICSCNCKEADNYVRNILKSTSANIYDMNIREHDKFIAFSLNIPHILNILFGQVLKTSGLKNSDFKNLASSTSSKQLKITEELFSENASLYHAIQHQNAEIENIFSILQLELNNLKRMVMNVDETEFITAFESVKEFFSL